MISVIVYGRNDVHGYNHHRRVALSLNCLAEVLTDPADEIIFVDYNTPDELPTAVEALADTLTDRCLGLLRVLRVPASLHAERYGGRTHLSVVEPVARNVAARRANPSNRWLLQTNSDMILVPLQGKSFSEVCRDLPDGFYGLPRFELPEWVWERLPRADPERALAEVERLGPALHLDEPTLGDKWVRFDAPGDFQLVLREDFLAVDGFDEEMVLGWHVDSNFTRRMRLHRGSIGTVEGGVAGYHCNHSRIPTVYHSAARISNDLDRFFYSVEAAALPTQRATWGFADVALEEVPLQRQTGPAFVEALLHTLPVARVPRASSDAVKASFGTSYDSGHVLPFIADSLVVSPLTTVGYFGINPILQRMLASLVEELRLGITMTVAGLADPNDVDELARSADLFVVDLGTDVSLVETSNVARLGAEAAHIPVGLNLVFAALERLVEVERARLVLGLHPRRFVLVNSSTVFFDAYALAEFDCSGTTVHCRVRRATVKPLAGDEVAKSSLLHARAVARWASGGRDDSDGLQLTPGESLRFGDLDAYFNLSAGWAFPDEAGVWTWGSRSDLSIAVPQIDDRDCQLTFMIDAVCVEPDEALNIELLVDGVRVARRDAFQSDAPFAWCLELEPRMLSGGTAKLTITVDEPRSPLAAGWSSDERPLGLHVRSLTLGEIDHSVQPGQSVVFGEGSDGERLLAGGWSSPDATGVWTDGERARLVLELCADPLGDAVVVLDVVPFLTPEHEELAVDVWALDTLLAHRVFRRDDLEGRLVLRLPPSVRDDKGRTVVDFRFDQPARPVDLGISSDARRLGLHLQSLTLALCIDANGLGEVDTSLAVGKAVSFIHGSGTERFLGDGWSGLEPTGVWTLGAKARISFQLPADAGTDLELVLDSYAYVSPGHPVLEVAFTAGNERLGTQLFRHGMKNRVVSIPLTHAVADASGRVVVDVEIDHPVSPNELGKGSDTRLLGLHLKWLMVRRTGVRGHWDAVQHRLRRVDQRRSGR